MGRVERSYSDGDPVGPLVKEMTQEAINLFEGSAGQSGPSQFTDEESARETLGTSGTVASGSHVHQLCPGIDAPTLWERRIQPHRHGRPALHPAREAGGYDYFLRGGNRDIPGG